VQLEPLQNLANFPITSWALDSCTSNVVAVSDNNVVLATRQRRVITGAANLYDGTNGANGGAGVCSITETTPQTLQCQFSALQLFYALGQGLFAIAPQSALPSGVSYVALNVVYI